MSVERTRETIQGYLDELLTFGDFARHLTDDVTMTFMGTDRAFAGREAVRAVITAFHQQAFRSHITLRSLVCGDDHALLEAEFKGTHIGEFEGVRASHRDVDVPYAVAYDLRGGRISALRLYFPFELLMRQITGAAEAVEV